MKAILERALESPRGIGRDPVVVPLGSGRAREEILALRRRATVTFDQVAGLETAKRAIGLAVGLAMAQAPIGIEIAPIRRILFYGPPGTGKTLLAAATSNAIRHPDGTPSAFYAAKVSELMSSAFGGSAKIVTELYAAAKASAPSVVFLDEFECLAMSRDSSAGKGAEERRILSTLLAELDGLADKAGAAPFVLTIAATNAPWNLDRAILSRFQRKILIPLPDEPARKRILELLTLARGYQLEDGVDLDLLAYRTEGFSGREIEALAGDVLSNMLASANPGLGELAIAEPERLADARIRTRPLSMEDFLGSLNEMEPATSPEERIRYTGWRAFDLSAAFA